MAKLSASERLEKIKEQEKRLSEQKKQILLELKQEGEQVLKDIGAKIVQAVKTNEQFKVDFLNLVKEHNIAIDFLDENN